MQKTVTLSKTLVLQQKSRRPSFFIDFKKTQGCLYYAVFFVLMAELPPTHTYLSRHTGDSLPRYSPKNLDYLNNQWSVQTKDYRCLAKFILVSAKSTIHLDNPTSGLR